MRFGVGETSLEVAAKQSEVKESKIEMEIEEIDGSRTPMVRTVLGESDLSIEVIVILLSR